MSIRPAEASKKPNENRLDSARWQGSAVIIECQFSWAVGKAGTVCFQGPTAVQ